MSDEKQFHQREIKTIKELDMPCPECGEPLVLKQGRYGMFIGCSAFPDCHYIAQLQEQDDTHIVCPICHKGHLVQRKSRFGKNFYACDTYPKCHFAVNDKPIEGRCQKCGFPLLVEKSVAGETRHVCADKKCQYVQQ